MIKAVHHRLENIHNIHNSWFFVSSTSPARFRQAFIEQFR